jgi:molybdopterin synthase catalytic subunit
MRVELRATPFDPCAELACYQSDALAGRSDFGAMASFIGTMRDLNEGAAVSAMTLEHYPGMTEAHLRRISAEAAQRWPILDTLIIHRVGVVRPAEPIVLVAAWSAHRAAAFDACRYLIEELKSRAPFWKQEQRGTVTHWVEHNTAAV